MGQKWAITGPKRRSKSGSKSGTKSQTTYICKGMITATMATLNFNLSRDIFEYCRHGNMSLKAGLSEENSGLRTSSNFLLWNTWYLKQNI